MQPVSELVSNFYYDQALSSFFSKPQNQNLKKNQPYYTAVEVKTFLKTFSWNSFYKLSIKSWRTAGENLCFIKEMLSFFHNHFKLIFKHQKKFFNQKLKNTFALSSLLSRLFKIQKTFQIEEVFVKFRHKKCMTTCKRKEKQIFWKLLPLFCSMFEILSIYFIVLFPFNCHHSNRSRINYNFNRFHTKNNDIPSAIYHSFLWKTMNINWLVNLEKTKSFYIPQLV